MPVGFNADPVPADPASTLQQVAAWHRRLDQHCVWLQSLLVHPDTGLGGGAVDVETSRRAAAVLRDFDQTVREHHVDEERALFPALLEAMAGSDARCIHDLIERLTSEHRDIATAWRALRPALVAVGSGAAQTLSKADVNRLVSRCRQHQLLEAFELLPMAARLLSDAAIDEVGRAMQSRRRRAAD